MIYSFQFIFTTKFAQNEKFGISTIVSKIKDIMYGSRDSIKICLQALAEDIYSWIDYSVLVLNLNYVIQIMERKDEDLYKWLMSQDIAPEFFNKLLTIKDKGIFKLEYPELNGKIIS